MLVPSSACFNTKATCASLNFDRFIVRSASWPADHNWNFPAPNGPRNVQQVKSHLAIARNWLGRGQGWRSSEMPECHRERRGGANAIAFAMAISSGINAMVNVLISI